MVTRQTLAGVWLSGNNLLDLSHRWYKVLKEIRVRPHPDSLIEMQTTQLKKSSALVKDMEYFEGLPINHEDKTYPWLMIQIRKHVHKHKEKI